MKIKETNAALRPYEKCLKNGPESLSDEELLAVIIRCGTRDEDSVTLSRRILSLKSGGLLNVIYRSIPELMRVKGVGEVKAIQIKCIGELSRRIARMSRCEQESFTTANAVAMYYMEELRHLKREKIKVMYLDAACAMLKDYEVSVGTVNASIASPREIFIEAFHVEAVNFILVHNHPSGNPMPSEEDLKLTAVLKKTGEMIGINLIDHVIIGDNKYISLKEQGII
ncbi:MAG: DNA repair protein RadC [Lachnospiraceae bacterium]